MLDEHSIYNCDNKVEDDRFDIKSIYMQENLFAEEFSISELEKAYKEQFKDYVFFKPNGEKISREELKEKMACQIKKDNMDSKKQCRRLNDGRSENGRFNCDNKNAEKLRLDNENVYILYLLCGSMEETARLLGVCRQTVSKKIKAYKNEKMKEYIR